MRLVILSYLHTTYLSADGLRQFVYEFYHTGVFVGSRFMLEMVFGNSFTNSITRGYL